MLAMENKNLSVMYLAKEVTTLTLFQQGTATREKITIEI